MPRLASPTQFYPPEPGPPSDVTLNVLRKDFRLAAISQFVDLLAVHWTGFEFDINDLEQDLDDTRPLNCVPTLLGKLLNVLANDRNVNSSNWLSALRRQYTRRVIPEENPFVEYIAIPVPPPGAAPDPAVLMAIDEAAEKAEETEVEGEKVVVEGEGTKEVDLEKTEKVKETLEVQQNLAKEVEDLVAVQKVDEVIEKPVEELKEDLEKVAEEEVKLSEVAVEEGIKQEDPEDMDVEGEAEEELPQAEPKLIYDTREIDWSEVSLEIKISAIYNVCCVWMLVDPEKLRRQLKWEEDANWRIEPVGSDSKKNLYYLLTDHRLWIQRVLPPLPRTLKLKLSAKPAEKEIDTEYSPEPSAIATPAASSSRPSRTREKAPPANARPSRGKKRGRTPDPVEAKKEEAPPSAKRQRGGRRATQEVWEEIPKELLEEWQGEDADGETGTATGGEEATRANSVAASSVLTSLSELSDTEDIPLEEGEAEPEPITSTSALVETTTPASTTTTTTTVAPTPAVPRVPLSVALSKLRSKGKKGKGKEIFFDYEEDMTDSAAEEEMMDWEKQYWDERKRMEETEGFVEWEAICITAEDFQGLVDKFAKSKDKNEKALRDYLALDIIPVIQADAEAKEKERQAQIAQMNRKRSSRIAIKESAEEEKARRAQEQEEAFARASRSSRHKILPTVDEPGSLSDTSKGGPVQESREERLRKREEEKKAREEAAELAAIEEAKKLAREELIKANGGVVPPGMETPEELKAMREKEEKERKRAMKEAARKRREAEKKRMKAEEDARRAAGIVDEDDEQWFLNCDGCGKRGWNLDESRPIISCDRCLEWQHLDCLKQADVAAGRPVADYDQTDYFCMRCRADPSRGPTKNPNIARPKPTPSAVPGGAPGPHNGTNADGTPMDKPKRKYKPRAPKLDAEGNPVPSKPRAPKPQRPADGTPQQPRVNGNSHPSGPAGPSSASRAAAPATVPTGIPGPGQPPLDYPSLLALIKSNPVLVNQLPPNYQAHFHSVLGIPVPYPTQPAPATNGHAPTPPRAAPVAPAPTQQFAPPRPAAPAPSQQYAPPRPAAPTPSQQRPIVPQQAPSLQSAYPTPQRPLTSQSVPSAMPPQGVAAPMAVQHPSSAQAQPRPPAPVQQSLIAPTQPQAVVPQVSAPPQSPSVVAPPPAAAPAIVQHAPPMSSAPALAPPSSN